jgi:hypothetical protein
MSKRRDNFFFRVEAGPFLAAVVQVPEAERGKWVMELALHLVSGAGSNEFAAKLIEEADAYRKSKSEAGKKGMETRWKDKKG